MNIRSIFAGLFGTNLFIAVSGVVSGVLLARFMSIDARGEVAQVFLWATIFSSLFSDSIKELIYTAKSDVFLPIRVWAIFLLLPVILSVLSFIGLGFESYIYYIVILCPINLYTVMEISKKNISGDFKFFNFSRVIIPTLYPLIITSLYFVFGYLTTDLVLFSNIASNVALLIYTKSKSGSTKNYEIDFCWSLLFKVVCSVIAVLLINQIDKIIMSLFYSEMEMAAYVVAMTVCVTPVTILSNTISNYMIYNFSKKEVCYEDSFYILKSLFYSALVLVLVCVFIVLIMPFIIPIVFGEVYTSSNNYLLLCAWLAFMLGLRTIFNSIFRSLSKDDELLKIQKYIIVSLIIVVPLMIGFKYEGVEIIIYCSVVQLIINSIFAYTIIRRDFINSELKV